MRTTLSSHELGQPDVYRDVVDPSVYVRFPVTEPTTAPCSAGDELLVWTTTPWTLVSNAAVAVEPGADLRPGAADDGAGATSSPRRWSSGCSARAPRSSSAFPGSTLEGVALRAAVPVHRRRASTAQRGHTVLLGDFVTAEDGTGLVHTAIAFGEDDFRLGEQYGLNVDQPGAARRHLRRAHRPVRRPLGQGRRPGPDRGPARRAAGCCAPRRYEHSYPHCWRCGTPLLYYAKPSWYIATSQIKDRLLAANETVNWHPEHVKHGRFGKWLENNVDWALSRERYWGTPLPVWRCENGHVTRDRLVRRARASSSGTRARGPAPPVRRRA